MSFVRPRGAAAVAAVLCSVSFWSLPSQAEPPPPGCLDALENAWLERVALERAVGRRS